MAFIEKEDVAAPTDSAFSSLTARFLNLAVLKLVQFCA